MTTSHQGSTWTRRGRGRDVVVAAVVLVLALVGAPPATVEPVLPRLELDPRVVVPLVVAGVLLVLRRDRPVAVWVGTLTMVVLLAVVTDEAGRGLPAAVVALYTVASATRRRVAVAAGLATAAVGLLAAWRSAAGLVDPVTLAVLPWCGLAAVLGDAVRVQREGLHEAQERARVAVLTREEEARRRVAEERLHLSRELHDVVGHHLAVINVQAGVAQRLAAGDPRGAAAALDEVRAAAGEALQQTGRLVGVLRTDDVEREPVPHLDRLPELVESLRAGGVEVSWERRGATTTGDPVVDQHAYRVLQEALTNAVRHGSGPVTVVTELGDASYRLEVTNPVRPEAAGPSGSGHGLVGMGERVALCGGVLDVRRDDARHVVRAELPVRSRPGAGR